MVRKSRNRKKKTFSKGSTKEISLNQVFVSRKNKELFDFDFESLRNFEKYFKSGNFRNVQQKISRFKGENFSGGRLSSPGALSPMMKRRKMRKSLKQINRFI